jgi:hypothetical protein
MGKLKNHPLPLKQVFEVVLLRFGWFDLSSFDICFGEE